MTKDKGITIIRGKSTPNYCPVAVPWEIVLPHQKQALQNHGQSLERLHERGGVNIQELYAILRDCPYDSTVSEQEAIDFAWKLFRRLT